MPSSGDSCDEPFFTRQKALKASFSPLDLLLHALWGNSKHLGCRHYSLWEFKSGLGEILVACYSS
jgi:hypothetical protein